MQPIAWMTNAPRIADELSAMCGNRESNPVEGWVDVAATYTRERRVGVLTGLKRVLLEEGMLKIPALHHQQFQNMSDDGDKHCACGQADISVGTPTGR